VPLSSPPHCLQPVVTALQASPPPHTSQPSSNEKTDTRKPPAGAPVIIPSQSRPPERNTLWSALKQITPHEIIYRDANPTIIPLPQVRRSTGVSDAVEWVAGRAALLRRAPAVITVAPVTGSATATPTRTTGQAPHAGAGGWPATPEEGSGNSGGGGGSPPAVHFRTDADGTAWLSLALPEKVVGAVEIGRLTGKYPAGADLTGEEGGRAPLTGGESSRAPSAGEETSRFAGAWGGLASALAGAAYGAVGAGRAPRWYTFWPFEITAGQQPACAYHAAVGRGAGTAAVGGRGTGAGAGMSEGAVGFDSLGRPAPGADVWRVAAAA
jgi:hypothetical protein